MSSRKRICPFPLHSYIIFSSFKLQFYFSFVISQISLMFKVVKLLATWASATTYVISEHWLSQTFIAFVMGMEDISMDFIRSPKKPHPSITQHGKCRSSSRLPTPLLNMRKHILSRLCVAGILWIELEQKGRAKSLQSQSCEAFWRESGTSTQVLVAAQKG